MIYKRTNPQLKDMIELEKDGDLLSLYDFDSRRIISNILPIEFSM
jgi:hypothetical protein